MSLQAAEFLNREGCWTDGGDDERAEADTDPPESFLLPQDCQLDWLARNAFIQRNASTKPTSSAHFNLPADRVPTSSRRPSLSLGRKASIIGLPSHKSRLFGSNFGRNRNVPLFQSWSEPGGKSAAQLSEPGSPKVSCMGRVGSKKGRGKRSGLWALLKARLWIGSVTKRVANSKRGDSSAELAEPEQRPIGLAGRSGCSLVRCRCR